MHTRAFTLADLAGIIVTTGATCAAMMFSCSQPEQPAEDNEAIALQTARQKSQQLRDATYLRGMGQALIIWSQNNRDRYPLPSEIDRQDFTVKAEGKAKDTSANIWSMLVWNGYVPVEMLVSPLEPNKDIIENESYQFDRPDAAASPELALWDPAFDADFTDGHGEVSYAHMQPAGKRRVYWASTFKATEAVLSSRGPKIKSIDDEFRVALENPKSNTLGMFKLDTRPDAWSGNLAFNDHHTEFVTNLYADGEVPENTQPIRSATKLDEDGKEKHHHVHDALFYDDPDTPRNHYLGIFTTAGDTPEDFTAIWD